jgi:hypothetical protein
MKEYKDIEFDVLPKFFYFCKNANIGNFIKLMDFMNFASSSLENAFILESLYNELTHKGLHDTFDCYAMLNEKYNCNLTPKDDDILLIQSFILVYHIDKHMHINNINSSNISYIYVFPNKKGIIHKAKKAKKWEENDMECVNLIIDSTLTLCGILNCIVACFKYKKYLIGSKNNDFKSDQNELKERLMGVLNNIKKLCEHSIDLKVNKPKMNCVSLLESSRDPKKRLEVINAAHYDDYSYKIKRICSIQPIIISAIEIWKNKDIELTERTDNAVDKILEIGGYIPKWMSDKLYDIKEIDMHKTISEWKVCRNQNKDKSDKTI